MPSHIIFYWLVCVWCWFVPSLSHPWHIISGAHREGSEFKTSRSHSHCLLDPTVYLRLSSLVNERKRKQLVEYNRKRKIVRYFSNFHRLSLRLPIFLHLLQGINFAFLKKSQRLSPLLSLTVTSSIHLLIHQLLPVTSFHFPQ